MSLTKTEVGSQRATLEVRELADLYALKTFYDYLQNTHDPLEVAFRGNLDSERSKRVLSGAKVNSLEDKVDVCVGAFSDISTCPSIGQVLVDITVLKNCSPALNDSEINELKREYGVPSDLPVVVIGFGNTHDANVRSAVKSLVPHSRVYVVGSGDKSSLDISEEFSDRVHVVTKHGVLKDYYAVADVALNAHNLRRGTSPLHNFVEATEGGPLFMVPSSNIAQYGYKELVDSRVIRECDSLDDLLEKVKEAIVKRDFGFAHRSSRKVHINKTREKYLPAIVKIINDVIEGRSPNSYDTDLEIESSSGGFLVRHPITSWGGGIYQPIQNLKNYSGLLRGSPVSISPYSEIKAFLKEEKSLYFSKKTIKDFPYNNYDLEKIIDHYNLPNRFTKNKSNKKIEYNNLIIAKPKKEINDIKIFQKYYSNFKNH